MFFVACFAASAFACWLWLQLARSRHWFDVPNERSSHTRPTPKGGGLGIAVVLLLVLLLLRQRGLMEPLLLWLCLPGIGLAIAGLVDDLRELGILPRLLLQGAAVLAAIMTIRTLPPLPLPWGPVSHPFLLSLVIVPAWVWLINLYNFMDGIDGLAATEGVFVALVLAWFALDAGLYHGSLLLLALAVILAGFLSFNWAPARLFMGDAGSNFLGYMLGAAGLYLAQQNAITLWTLLILLGVFMVDSTLTLLKRMWAGAVWYHGHRSHAYQVMARAFGSHSRVVGWAMLINVGWLLPLSALSVAKPQAGVLLVLLAYSPLLLLVHFCQLRHLGLRLQ